MRKSQIETNIDEQKSKIASLQKQLINETGDKALGLKREVSELSSILSQLENKLREDVYRFETQPIEAIEQLLQNWDELSKTYYKQEVEKVKNWRTSYKEYYRENIQTFYDKYGENQVENLPHSPELQKELKLLNLHRTYQAEYLSNKFPEEIIEYSNLEEDLFEKSLDCLLRNTKHHRRIDLYESFYTKCNECVGEVLDTSKLQVISAKSVQGVVLGSIRKAYIYLTFISDFSDYELKYTIEVNPINIKVPTTHVLKGDKSLDTEEKSKPVSYKDKTLKQLKDLAKKLNLNFKEYSDDRITRMRLVMLLKKEQGAANKFVVNE